MNPKGYDTTAYDGRSMESITRFSHRHCETQKPQQQQRPEPHKKQVRRRVQTSRPYKEKLINMAEARREIVTALKHHRAAMKQANEREKQQHEQSGCMQLPQQLFLDQGAKTLSRRNPRIYPSSTSDYSNYTNHASYSCSSFYPPSPPAHPSTWPAPQLAPPIFSDLNLVLPSQTLGLNLNMHDFDDLDASLYYCIDKRPNDSTPLSCSSSSTSMAAGHLSTMVISQDVGLAPTSDGAESSGGDLHQVMDDEEIAASRSISEQHQMEWNDTINLVTSAWWSNFLKTTELGPQEKTEEDVYHPFDEVMQFSSCLNSNESCLQHHTGEFFPDEFFQDPDLRCMEIGEIEGMDDEWLS